MSDEQLKNSEDMKLFYMQQMNRFLVKAVTVLILIRQLADETESVKDANKSFSSISDDLTLTKDDVSTLHDSCDTLMKANESVVGQISELSAYSEEVAAQAQCTLAFVEESAGDSEAVSKDLDQLYDMVQEVNQ